METQTKLLTYSEWSEKHGRKLIKYIFYLLYQFPDGLNSKDISEYSKLKRESLTSPLNYMCDKEILTYKISLCIETGRFVKYYKTNI